MSEKSEKAKELFKQGYNCSQSVLGVFCEELGMDFETAMKISSSFGGGIGRLREVCGTVSGALLALGMILGYSDPADPQAKAAHYSLVQEYARRFREKNESIVCRELLKDVVVTPGAVPEPRTPEFYARRPCLRLAGEAAAILDEMLAEQLSTEKENEK